MAINKEKRQIARLAMILEIASHHAFRGDYLVWYDWEKRIKDGHQTEKEKIRKLYEDAPPDVIGEEYSITCELTNNMYAALIVSIWSEMEHFLKLIVRACIARNEQKKRPYRFDQIEKEIEKETGLQLEKCDGYPIVNAVRNLNNAFKHSNGRYKSKPNRPDTQIENSLLVKWEIEEGQSIDYSKLPVQEIISACNEFCNDLLGKVETKLTDGLREGSAR